MRLLALCQKAFFGRRLGRLRWYGWRGLRLRRRDSRLMTLRGGIGVGRRCHREGGCRRLALGDNAGSLGATGELRARRRSDDWPRGRGWRRLVRLRGMQGDGERIGRCRSRRRRCHGRRRHGFGTGSSGGTGRAAAGLGEQDAQCCVRPLFVGSRVRCRGDWIGLRKADGQQRGVNQQREEQCQEQATAIPAPRPGADPQRLLPAAVGPMTACGARDTMG